MTRCHEVDVIMSHVKRKKFYAKNRYKRAGGPKYLRFVLRRKGG